MSNFRTCLFVTFYPHFPNGWHIQMQGKRIVLCCSDQMAHQIGVYSCTYLLSCVVERLMRLQFCFFWPPHGIFILAWRSGLGKRPSDDHHHHSLRGRLAQCKPSMSSTVRTFFGVKQLRSPPSRPQSGYVCQRQTTKVKDKIQTHCTYKEWRHKELGWPSSPQQQREAPPNMLLFFGTKSLKIQ